MSQARPAAGIALTSLCLLLIVGLVTFAAPCVAHADATPTCVLAARATTGVAAVALALSLVRVFERDEGERRGLDVGIMLTGALAALMCGPIVEVCAEAAMRCQHVTCPFTRVVGALIALVAAVDLTRRLLAIGRGSEGPER